MQFNQRENYFTDGMKVDLRVQSSNLNVLWKNILETDGQIKFKRL